MSWQVMFCHGPYAEHMHFHDAETFEEAEAWAKAFDESLSDYKSYVGLESMKNTFVSGSVEGGCIQYGTNYNWVEFREMKDKSE